MQNRRLTASCAQQISRTPSPRSTDADTYALAFKAFAKSRGRHWVSNRVWLRLGKPSNAGYVFLENGFARTSALGAGGTIRLCSPKKPRAELRRVLSCVRAFRALRGLGR